MPLGSFTMFVVCAECGGSVDATMRRDRIEVGPCLSCVSRAGAASFDAGWYAGSMEV